MKIIKCFYFNQKNIGCQKLFTKIIRDKIDLIYLIADTLEYILVADKITKENTSNDYKIIIVKSKMSRVFYCLPNKIFSINFPFSINELEDGKLNFSILGQDIDLVLISYIREICYFLKNNEVSIKEYLNYYFEKFLSLEDQYEGILKIFNYFLHMEDGYIRYDNDTKNENGKKHPQHHFDLFYCTSNTFKVGLHHNCTLEHFQSMLDCSLDCFFLEKFN